MYRNAYQKGGFLTVFYTIGRNPLQYWKCQTRDGHCKRVLDEDLNSMSLELLGTNVSTCLITTPIPPYRSLGIKMPFITIILKNLQKYCTFEIEVRDHENQLRRFQASTFQPHTRTNMFITQMPLRLDPGWNKVEINLADFTHRAYGTRYMETVSIRINANIQLRRIYFSDQLYSEEDKPREYRLCVSDYIPPSASPIEFSDEKALPSPPERDASPPQFASSPEVESPPKFASSPEAESPPAFTPLPGDYSPPAFAPGSEVDSPQEFSAVPEDDSPPAFVPGSEVNSPPESSPALEINSPPEFVPASEVESPPEFSPAPEVDSPPKFAPQSEVNSPPESVPATEVNSPPEFASPPEVDSPPEFASAPEVDSSSEVAPPPAESSPTESD